MKMDNASNTGTTIEVTNIARSTTLVCVLELATYTTQLSRHEGESEGEEDRAMGTAAMLATSSDEDEAMGTSAMLATSSDEEVDECDIDSDDEIVCVLQVTLIGGGGGGVGHT